MVLWSLLSVATHEVILAPLIEIVVTLKLYVLSLLLQVPDIVDSVPPPFPEPLQVSSPLTVIVKYVDASTVIGIPLKVIAVAFQVPTMGS